MNVSLVLVHPEIPHNTGAIGRVCVALDMRLHLIQPLGFDLRDRHLRRAGLDYWEHLDLTLHRSWEQFLETEQPSALCMVSSKGTRSCYEYHFKPGTHIVLGSESGGFPEPLYTTYAGQLVNIPMPGPHARCLNLATAAAIVAYEAFRQLARPNNLEESTA